VGCHNDELEEEDSSGMLQDEDEAVARSKAKVEATVCSEAGDEAAACSGVEIEDGKRRRD
jgi:hypothetical protein